MDQRCFRLNEPDVSAEDFRSEILAVNLKSGNYHSFRQSAVPIWRLLMAGRSPQTIIDWLAPAYQCGPEALAADVGSFVSELEKDELIVVAREKAEPPPATPPDWVAELAPPYAKPLIETYTEMRELLLLDPVHDVDITGWPNLPETKPDKP